MRPLHDFFKTSLWQNKVSKLVFQLMVEGLCVCMCFVCAFDPPVTVRQSSSSAGYGLGFGGPSYISIYHMKAPED